MKHYFTIKAFKCPNGNPPDECKHVQQLIINLANYYKKKKELKAELENEKAQAKQQQNAGQPIQTQQRQRTRG